MKANQPEKGKFSNRGEGLGTVTQEMIQHRAAEIAVINGRSRDNVLGTDREQARRELRGEERLAPSPPKEEQLPEASRWQPVPPSPGKAAPTKPASDEQTFAQELTEEGVAEAEHDQQIKATEESLRREKRS